MSGYGVKQCVLPALLVLTVAGPSDGFAQTAPHQRALRLDLRIASDTKETILTAPSDLEVAPNGTIYLLQPEEQIIRVFGPSGKFSRKIGRAGGGPGEFRWPMRLGWNRDSLWAWDAQLARISVFDSNGKFARSIPIGTVGSVRLLRDGTIAVKRYVEDALPSAAGGLSAPILRYSTEGQILDTIVDFEVKPVAPLRIPVGRGLAQAPQPWGDAPLWDVAPSGTSIVIVERPVAPRAGWAHFRVTKLGLAGDTIFSKSYPYMARPLTSEMVDSVVEGWVSRLTAAPPPPGGGKVQVDREIIRKAIHRTPTLPPVTAVAIGHDERIWLRGEEDATQSSVLWTLLDNSGVVLATVAGPKQLQIYRARGSAVWGVENDGDGVPSIVRYVMR